MPKSHDQKPRNADRRVKGQQSRLVFSDRSRNRRVLRSRSITAQVLERYVVRVLEAEGKKWRDFELATQAGSRRIVGLAQARMNIEAAA